MEILLEKMENSFLLGDIEVNNGSLEVNGNTFQLDKAIVIFNDRKDYLPNINPTLIIDSKVKVDNDEIGDEYKWRIR